MCDRQSWRTFPSVTDLSFFSPHIRTPCHHRHQVESTTSVIPGKILGVPPFCTQAARLISSEFSRAGRSLLSLPHRMIAWDSRFRHWKLHTEQLPGLEQGPHCLTVFWIPFQRLLPIRIPSTANCVLYRIWEQGFLYETLRTTLLYHHETAGLRLQSSIMSSIMPIYFSVLLFTVRCVH